MSIILITGASGFVGKLLGEKETGRGNTIVGLHLPEETPELPFESRGIDLRDAKGIRNYIQEKKPERVYHLAALSSVRACEEHPVDCFDSNVTGTMNLLEALSELPVKPRILFTSSCEVYGSVPPSSQPVDEKCPPSPINVYGFSKVIGEKICRFYSNRNSLPVMISRGFNHTGPGQAQHFVFPHVARTLARIELGKEESVLRMGNLSVRRDFLDARDVVNAYMTIMDKSTPGKTYNVTSARCISIEEGVNILVEISGIKVKIITDESRMRSYDIPELSGSSALLESELGWHAEKTLEETFKDMLLYWRKKEGAL